MAKSNIPRDLGSLKFIIEYEISVKDFSETGAEDLNTALDNLRGAGAADITDVRMLPPKEKK